MNANITKLISSAAAVLAIGSSAYAEEAKACPPKECTFKQGYELCKDTYPAAYNAPARTEVECGWDVFLTGGFTYWYADQEGMNLAYPATALTYLPQHVSYLKQEFEYKPGFKVGLGCNFNTDHWVGFIEYTWFRSTTSVSMKTPPSDPLGGTSVWIPDNWFHGGGYSFSLNEHPMTKIGSKWRLGIDLVDGTLSRPFYEGRKLTVTPFGGLRAAWIRQNIQLTAATAAIALINSHTYSHSWAIGPRAGCQAHWLLGYGFRMEGDLAGSLLYSRYTVSHREDPNPTDTTSATIKYTDVSLLRPMADMGIGLGWGSYLDQQKYHFDLLATYDFNVMWGQNQMRALADEYSQYIGAEAGDLHLQGLTVSARLDF